MKVKGQSLSLMPAAPGTCPLCAALHGPTEAHNAQSLFYQMRFYGAYGRWPTWADAVAHCAAKVRELWRQQLEQRGLWTEPADGPAIAEVPE